MLQDQRDLKGERKPYKTILKVTFVFLLAIFLWKVFVSVATNPGPLPELPGLIDLQKAENYEQADKVLQETGFLPLQDKQNPIPQITMRAFQPKVAEIFGQTELCVLVGNFPWMKVCPGSMGKPSPQFDVDLVDDDDKSCPPGIVGEIVVRTRRGRPVGMFLGYEDEPERTREVWHDNMYHTLDLAWRDEWGYYWYVGRKDDVIKSSGYRIGPFEVESALMEHPAVVETAITGVPDPVRGQVVKATIVLAKGYEPTEALKKELQNHVKKATAPYKYPRIVEFVDELPKTISGKIRRVELRERDNH